MANADMFLQVEGQVTGVITGEANAPDHFEEIEVLSWSWGMTGSQALGGRGASTRTALSEMQVSKRTDRASTQLMSVMRNNEVIKKAVLSVRRAGTNPPEDYLVVTIKRGRLTSHTIGTASPGSAILVENLSLAFEEIEVTYTGQEGTGSAGAALSFVAEVHTD